ncbi:hypothetical protein PCC7424_1773 [Gloeothece citriformis PCC 7424]|uniref:Uncharacterized protein n=1 Tax=Gloeothece citriformis (strain PCC 7424) TaxID=65393 RepID=B7KCA2_GLOC7|nr:hypothetical protein PCC7424_1773 [Gloeothece citriformis PCC 7424]
MRVKQMLNKLHLNNRLAIKLDTINKTDQAQKN